MVSCCWLLLVTVSTLYCSILFNHIQFKNYITNYFQNCKGGPRWQEKNMGKLLLIVITIWLAFQNSEFCFSKSAVNINVKSIPHVTDKPANPINLKDTSTMINTEINSTTEEVDNKSIQGKSFKKCDAFESLKGIVFIKIL